MIHRVTPTIVREVPLRLRRIAWVAAWREIEMQKPTDTVSVRLMSKFPGCNGLGARSGVRHALLSYFFSVRN